MNYTCFEAIYSPTNEEIDSIACISQHTPFNTTPYATACAVMGEVPCVLTLRVDSHITSGCLGFLKRGFRSSRLEILSIPRLSQPTVFWDGVLEFCKKRGVWELVVGSFGSEIADIPRLTGEVERRIRCEFLLDLTSPVLFNNMSSNHRRSINRARRAGLVLQRTREANASQVHLKLIQDSMERRKNRGEDISIPKSTLFTEALLKSEAAELFQIIDGGVVLSSILVLRSNKAAYYQTAGTSPNGMKIGASQFLIFEVARVLKEEGVCLFNLGGAGPDEQGLQRFKAGFGAKKITLEAASFSMVSPIKKLRSSAILILQNPVAFFTEIFKCK